MASFLSLTLMRLGIGRWAFVVGQTLLVNAG